MHPQIPEHPEPGAEEPGAGAGWEPRVRVLRRDVAPSPAAAADPCVLWESWRGEVAGGDSATASVRWGDANAQQMQTPLLKVNSNLPFFPSIPRRAAVAGLYPGYPRRAAAVGLQVWCSCLNAHHKNDAFGCSTSFGAVLGSAFPSPGVSPVHGELAELPWAPGLLWVRGSIPVAPALGSDLSSVCPSSLCEEAAVKHILR